MAERNRGRAGRSGRAQRIGGLNRIERLRQRIDELDERLVELLNERATCALEVGEIKQAHGLDIYQPDREAQVLNHVRRHGAAGGGPLRGEALTRLFERIIDEARRLERESATEHRGRAAGGGKRNA
jgi:chorismate mutase-like protein